jgi:hypothetical protein
MVLIVIFVLFIFMMDGDDFFFPGLDLFFFFTSSEVYRFAFYKGFIKLFYIVTRDIVSTTRRKVSFYD